MATISSDKDWNKYVRDNPQSTSTKYPVENGVINEPVFTNTNYRDILTYVSEKEIVNIISKNPNMRGRSKFANVRVNGRTGYLRAGAIRKPTGKGGADAEQRTLDVTINNLNLLSEVAGIGKNNKVGIDLLVPGLGFFLGVSKIEKVPNRIHGREAKSDFVMKNSLGKGVLFISHKDGTGPQAFGQYGGVSGIAGNIQDAAKIYNQPEIQRYLTRLHELYSDATGGTPQIRNNPFNSTGKLTKAVYALVMDPTLVNMSVYGPDYGGAFGPDNVHMIGQGSFIFNPLVNDEGDIYFRLSFSGHQALNGDVRDFMNNSSGYRATIITTFRSGRPTQTPNGPVPETRTAIYPRRYRSSAIQIDTLT